ncbi:HNH endonuclease signature motif containing protein [Nocardioides sp. SR21]|uniref:HNH endonuclease signature motif containing protein n=1 Tax=Nocardioides sp. SR21 TaxID=2919501 RepID=UPI001FA9F1CF|nr:HNH endonuclease signature motif containing protein [Nocardioides sp. SR21]
MTTTSTLTREQVLKVARQRQAAAVKAEIDKLQLAVEWAALNPGDVVDASRSWEERELEVAGDEAPTVAEFSIAEFALAVGMNTDAGRVFIGDAVELAHRLPRTWARVLGADVASWKARKFAQQTKSLPVDAAAFVDRALAPVLHTCTFAQIERTVEAARAEFDPQAAEQRRQADAEHRHLTFYWRQVTSTGQVPVAGVMDLADAVALDENLKAKAATLDPALPIDVRRSIAAGMLGSGDSDAEREVVIYTHAQADSRMVEVENTRTVVTPEQVQQWCQTAGTTVTVRPVLDLNEDLATDAYTPTERQQEQVVLTFPRCVFPGCSRRSRSADNDHITEFPIGRTDTRNLAPLCRHHHRVKTFTAWTYHRTGPRTFTWTSPTGCSYHVRVDRHIR